MGLVSFPSLRRVTLLNNAWGPNYLIPVYGTPFFRSLPTAFMMPTDDPWLGALREPWDAGLAEHEEDALARSWDEPHREWRGYGIVVSEILVSAPHHHVCELAIDVHRQLTGISHHLFTSLNEDYNSTLRLFDTLPLTRLELALNTKTAADSSFACFRNGLLKNALSKLRHLSISPSMPVC
jgi:hypothetical protein